MLYDTFLVVRQDTCDTSRFSQGTDIEKMQNTII